MRIAALAIFLALPVFHPMWGAGEDTEEAAVRSEIRTTAAGERILVQRVLLDAPRKEVWDAYVTEEGWTAWASPKAKIELRVGGTIQTHYDASATIGDAGTNTLHILAYVPEELLTLRADVSVRWPEVMKEDADNLSNVIVFREVAADRTEILSYGIGYRDLPEYDTLLKFFNQANEGLFEKLIRYVETGERQG